MRKMVETDFENLPDEVRNGDSNNVFLIAGVLSYFSGPQLDFQPSQFSWPFAPEQCLSTLFRSD
jgi:hypothetical protein